MAGGIFSPMEGIKGRPYTKWYRVWERVTIADFYAELFILPVIIIVIAINMYGARLNKLKAKAWMATHLPMLDAEFAQVGFKKRSADKDSAKAMMESADVPEDMLKQKGKNELFTYATGRQNVAHLDLQLTLYKRYNPFLWLAETLLSFFFDSIAAPVERVEATAYVFDGKEKSLVPGGPSAGGNSSFDGFVFAIVHKDKMKQLRDDRYDISLTKVQDHAKLPDWATIMSESAEITEALLTPELVKAVEDCGEDLEALIITDQPIERPMKLDDTVPKKRVSLAMRLDPNSTSTAIFQTFLRLPDVLVNTAHFRPEAMRKVRATRDEETKRIQKVDEDEKAEERRTVGDKMKKDERERKLAGMKPAEQKKFLEKERAKEQKRGEKKQSKRS